MTEGGIAEGLSHTIKQNQSVMTEGGIAEGLSHTIEQTQSVTTEGGLNHAVKQKRAAGQVRPR